ncbi:MAG: PQQ-dependent sugar dehydrogenase [Planctomycetes bacterium]|nr:PQQ-dependent sugar dehydrogenase [Planctomycetota bacterium]
MYSQQSNRRATLFTGGALVLLVSGTLSAQPHSAHDAMQALDMRRVAAQHAYEQYALTHDGDAQRGRELFLDEKATKCITCHKVNGQGGDVGPDLSQIGAKFARPHLIESLLEPSRQILEGFRTTVIATVHGQMETGIVKASSADSIMLTDANGKQRVIATAEIDDRQETTVSLMPQGLAETLTESQLTDVIAYLETLRPEGTPKWGAGVAGAIKLPPGFEVKTIATGLTACTALETSPDGRIFVCEQTGSLRVIKDGQLLPQPVLTLPVEAYWERGLIGVTVDPDFPRSPYVYVCYVVHKPFPHHRVSRFTLSGDIADADSEKVLLTGDDQSRFGGKVPAGHQGGALHFGPDGKLYIGIGEQTAGAPSQDMSALQGKILRINRDGTIPADNPFLAHTSGKYQSIWAVGLRNPYTFAIRKRDGEMLINDVGDKFEEVNRGLAGGNYGWPVVDGPTEDSRYQSPVHFYPHASACGADFGPDDLSWPATYRGKYFFAEFIHGWIKTIDPEQPERVETFATGLRNPVDLRFGSDGSLYVLLRNAWVMDDKFQTNTGTLLQIRYAGAASATVGLTEDATDESAGGLSAYKIETPTATYFLEKSGAGLSSLIDKDGNDWLSFRPDAGSGAGGEFRGFPNAVHKQDGSYFHPRNQGTDPATIKVEYVSDDRVTISAESNNGLWACQYDFFATHCTFSMTRMPAGKKYWALYEGTPGGEYDDDDWWMTSAVRERRPLTQIHEGDIPSPEWIAFGDKRLARCLFLLHHEDDPHADRFYQMQGKMTVFGFGRQGVDKLIDKVPQRFSIGFIETTDHRAIGEEVSRLPR